MVKEYKVVDLRSNTSFHCAINTALVFECHRPNGLVNEQEYE